MRWFRRRGNPDPERFLAELSHAHPGTANYSHADRYADFRALFLETERGRRVLFEIMSWGHMFRASADIANFETNRTMFADGERNMALRIMTTMNAEPMAMPTKADKIKE